MSLTLPFFSVSDKLSSILMRGVNTVLTNIEFMVITYQDLCLIPSLVLKLCVTHKGNERTICGLSFEGIVVSTVQLLNNL